MKKMKTLIVTGVMVLLLGATTAGVFASSSVITPEENLQYKIERLQERVELGLITQARADEIAAILEENILNCDGSGQARSQRLGLGLGFGQARNQGLGFGMGRGLCDGSEMRIRQGQ